jgi:hypothetical protein
MKTPKTKRLNTGVEITFNNKGEIKTLTSPYYNENPQFQMTILDHLVCEIKKIIKNA